MGSYFPELERKCQAERSHVFRADRKDKCPNAVRGARPVHHPTQGFTGISTPPMAGMDGIAQFHAILAVLQQMIRAGVGVKSDIADHRIALGMHDAAEQPGLQGRVFREHAPARLQNPARDEDLISHGEPTDLGGASPVVFAQRLQESRRHRHQAEPIRIDDRGIGRQTQSGADCRVMVPPLGTAEYCTTPSFTGTVVFEECCSTTQLFQLAGTLVESVNGRL